MTAEIAVLNSEGIALASDSAVTSELEYTQKISTSSNKIFSLSNDKPVGIMIYGNARFVNYPWETIIKVFRNNNLSLNGYPTLEDYATSFINYLISENLELDQFDEDNYIAAFVELFLYKIRKDSFLEVDSRIEQGEEFSSTLLHECTLEVVNGYDGDFSSGNIIIPINQGRNVINRYRRGVRQSIQNILGDILSQPERSNIIRIIINAFSRHFLEDLWTGVVIVGFGERELLPHIYSYKVEGRFNYITRTLNRPILKYEFDEDKSVTSGAMSAVVPFAEDNMVHRFMNGVDPYYLYAENSLLSNSCDNFVGTIVSQLDRYNDDEKASITQQLNQHTNQLLAEFDENMSQVREQYFSNPVTEAVSRMPKDELGTIAEALVHLTSLKLKMSEEPETVAGPIDVALITKGDGFIWIKRKHYFDADKNIRYSMKLLKEILYGREA